MGHYRKTNPTTAVVNLMKQALIVQRWAENEGSAEQRKIANGWVKIIAQYATRIAPKFIGVPLSDQASYDANQHVFKGVKPVGPTEAELEQIYYAAVDLTFLGQSYDELLAVIPFSADDEPEKYQAHLKGLQARLTTTNSTE
jgi:hypothetical protein